MGYLSDFSYLKYSSIYFTAQSYSNPQEYDPARVQPTVPDYSNPPPNWPFSPYPTKPNPNYPGYYLEPPIYSTPSFNNNPYCGGEQKFGLSKSGIIIREGAGFCYLDNKTQIIYNNNSYYNEQGEIVNPIYDIVRKCQFRINQLIDVEQFISLYYYPIQLNPLPAVFNPNSDPETWIVSFVVPKNSCFVGQEIGFSAITSGAGSVIVKTVNEYNEIYDLITARSVRWYLTDQAFDVFGLQVVNPIRLKAQVTDIQYNDNELSENLGEISVFFETYQVENTKENYSALSNWFVKWQHQAGNYDSDGQNYNQNESYAAKQSYNITLNVAGASRGYCSFDFSEWNYEGFVTSDTDFLKSGYSNTFGNARWEIYDDDEANRPWNGVQLSVDYKIEKTRTTTNYYYPNLILMPPYYNIEDSYSETNTVKNTDYGSISKTFYDGDFSLTSSSSHWIGPTENGHPSGQGSGFCWGTKPDGPLTSSNNLIKYKSGEYEAVYQEITFQKYVPPSPPYPAYYIPDKRIVSISEMTMQANLLKDRDEKYGDLPGIEFGMVSPQSFLP